MRSLSCLRPWQTQDSGERHLRRPHQDAGARGIGSLGEMLKSQAERSPCSATSTLTKSLQRRCSRAERRRDRHYGRERFTSIADTTSWGSETRRSVYLAPGLLCAYNVITMRTELIRIGNSRGVRIPKPLIEECGLGETVEIQVIDRRIIVSPQRSPRESWSEAFRKAGSPLNDELLMDLSATEFDRKDWRW